MKHDFEYAHNHYQKIKPSLHFDQTDVSSGPIILTAIDICLRQKRHKYKEERKKTMAIKQKQNKDIGDRNTQETSISKYKQKRPHIKVGLDSFLPGQLSKANFGLWVPPIKLLNGLL